MIGGRAVKPQSVPAAVGISGGRKVPQIGEGTYACCRYVWNEQHERAQVAERVSTYEAYVWWRRKNA
jgi:hypothetical protein